ncbi:MAG: Abi family protein [Clostridia bacterium]|nr:Abi family protein [Clostridia bacterium]
MSKPYLSPRQQVQHLITRKGLIVRDTAFAERKLTDIEYTSLIGGYKTPFINPMTRMYEGSTTFEDILELYLFDKDLRLLTFGALNTVEEKIRQLISDAFCSHFGEMQSAFLNPKNYRPGLKCAGTISNLINRHLLKAVNDNNHSYIVHQRNAYGNVPLWVAGKLLTFGELSIMYSVLQIQQQTRICSAFPSITEQELENSLCCLTLFRNVCAHNERLYSYRLNQHDFIDTPLHAKLGIPKKGNKYILGKCDYFGLVITLRYLLPKEEFLNFKRQLRKCIESYTRKSKRISNAELLGYMGMPANWESITRYRL